MMRAKEWESRTIPTHDQQAAVVWMIESGETAATGAFRPNGNSMDRMAGVLLLGLLLALSPDPDDDEPIEDDKVEAAQSLLSEFAMAL